MNTPAHAAINLLLLNRDGQHRKTAVIVVGAILPDLAIVLFYAWHLASGTPETQIWSIDYYRPLWQGWIDGFNSVPIIVTAMAICWYARQPLLTLLFGSMLLHVCGDLPLHHDDAHRHFFPFFDWRFASPISYWDPAHYGTWASLVEIACVGTAATWLYRRWPELKWWILATVSIYVLYWIYVYIVWM